MAIKRGRVISDIELAGGPFRVVSLLSTDSLDDLGLKPGDHATAVVKATTVIVEREE